MPLRRWRSSAALPSFELFSMDTTTLNSEFAAFDAEVDRFESDYEAQAEGKAGIQKGMDAVRSLFNRGADGKGYGDDQFKNVANTQHALDELKADVKAGRLNEQQAQQALSQLRQHFNSEADRVEDAQVVNASRGKALHGAGRVAAVSVAGIAGTLAGGGGNVPAGVAAAAAAGSAYDALTVGAGAVDKKLGNGGNTAIAPALDTKQSVGGLAAGALAGQQVEAKDVVQAGVGTALDAVSGFGAGQGIKAARAGIAAANGTKQVAQAAATASVKTGFQESAARLGVQTAGTAIDPSLDAEQKSAQMVQQGKEALVQLPAQLVFSAGSSAAGAVVKPVSKLLDGLAQFGIDGVSNLGQASVGNVMRGDGSALSGPQLVEAAVLGIPGALHNMAQHGGPPEDAGLQYGMNPYSGRALKRVPRHDDGLAVVFGDTAGLRVDRGAAFETLELAITDRGTHALWPGNGNLDQPLQALQSAQPEQALHVYRAFEQPISKEKLLVETALQQPHSIGSVNKKALDRLLHAAGFDVPTPAIALVDETPVNVLPATLDDRMALFELRAATLIGQQASWMTTDDSFRRTQLGSLATSSEWLHHYLAGSGQPKLMTAQQVREALLATVPGKGLVDSLNTPGELSLARKGLSVEDAIGAQISAQRAEGATRGDVQGITQDNTFTAGFNNGWYHTIGSAHVFGVYKGKWQDSGDGLVQFTGERHWLVQDRYNWAAPDFNGRSATGVVPTLPRQLLHVLPQSYKDAFGSEGHTGGLQLHDAMFAHLQMLEGGAQPFWTFGLSEPQKMDVTLPPNAPPEAS
jgi:hypothetical protein